MPDLFVALTSYCGSRSKELSRMPRSGSCTRNNIHFKEIFVQNYYKVVGTDAVSAHFISTFRVVKSKNDIHMYGVRTVE